MKLKNQVAIVTGSTSGMGRAIAETFAREGAKVMVTGRNEARAKEVVDGIKAQGFEASYVIADTSTYENCKLIVDRTLETYGTVDILVNNAGSLSISPLLDLSKDEWQNTFDVNVNAAFHLIRMVAPIMKGKGKGVVVNTVSVAALAAHHGFAAYVSSKHAMAGLSKSMAWELGPEIRVNAIAPGAIHTAMLDSVGGPDALRHMIDNCPLKRVGQPQDIANVALFLASDDSSFIDGQVINVDGGYEI